MSKTVAVFGSTGLVGSTLTEELKKHGDIGKIYAYARKPPMFLGEKMEFKPFETNNFKISSDVDIVFCALGTTIKKAGSREDFREVDLHAVQRIVQKSKEAGVKDLVVISSIGANKDTNNFYLRTKGEMEEAVLNTGIEHTVIIRPSLLMGKRKEKRIAEDIGKIIFQPLSFLMIGPLKQYRPVPAKIVAQKMIEAALTGQKGFQILENRNLF